MKKETKVTTTQPKGQKITRSNALKMLKDAKEKGLIHDRSLSMRITNLLKKADADGIKTIDLTVISDLVTSVSEHLKSLAPNTVEAEKKSMPKLTKKESKSKAEVKPKAKLKKEPEPVEEEEPTLESLDVYPDVLETEIGTLHKAKDSFNTLEEVTNALEEGVDLYCAFYFPADLIKECNYKEMYDVNAMPRKFPNDLDIYQIPMTLVKTKKVPMFSIYTEAFGYIHAKSLKRAKNAYAREEYASGATFELYVATDEE